MTRMTRRKDADLDDLIGRVYDVALDPSRYEDLLDKWESTIAPLRQEDDATLLLDEPGIIGHFERADAVLDGMGAREPVSEVDTLLSQFGNVAALVISDRMVITGLNDNAARGLGLTIGTGISALPLEPDDRAALARQVARMLGEAGAEPSVFRVRRAEEGQFVVFHMRRQTLRDGAPIIVAVTSDLRWPTGFDEILSAAFDLSNAETDVVRRLVECGSVKDIAEARGRSIETVRAQIKAILAKTETRSQVELIRLALSMMDIAGVTEDARPGPRVVSAGMGQLEPKTFARIFDGAGRSIEYIVLGDPKGTPVLYFHMDFGFIRWPAEAEAEAARLGLRIIVPVRGGYGHSDPAARGMDLGEATARDALAVLEAEGVTRAPVISQAGDHMMALRLEQIAPGTVTALIACAAAFPCATAEQVERMHKWHRFIQAGARYTPHLLPFLVKAGFHLARRGGKRAFVHSVFGDSPADIATFEDEQVFEALVTGSEVCLSETHSAHQGFTRQVLWEHGPGLQELLRWSEGRMPYHALNGMQDPGMHPDTINEYAAALPWIDFRRYDDAGQLLFFRHWRDVLALVLRYV